MLNYELQDAILGRYTNQKIHMIRYHMSLYDFYPFPFTQIFNYVSNIRSKLVVYNFPTIFRYKYYMIRIPISYVLNYLPWSNVLSAFLG